MITIFTIPKPFKGHINTIQRNAIRSWKKLHPQIEIILFGNEEGIPEVAKEFNLIHVPDIEKNEFNTPLLSSAFEIAQNKSKHSILMYCNCDIILFPEMLQTIKSIKKSMYLVCGRRWDLNIDEVINFEDNEQMASLFQNLKENGFLHGMCGLDYFVFPKNSVKMQPFAVGRPAWDGWLIFDRIQKKIPVIDATEAITIIHQNHDYSHSKFGKSDRVEGPELLKNLDLAGGFSCLMTLRNADWILSPEQKLKRPYFLRYFFSILLKYSFFRRIISLKRQISETTDSLKKNFLSKIS
ncbi:MAG: hypothetical protein HQM08_21610 [Candidatus Riflebacteria bacterium]|nr:hypothetical protein [Candidatus Riflebacteria bacterium]